MKRIITTVGTSLFTNYKNKIEVIRNYPVLKQDYENITTQYDSLNERLNDKGEKESISASEYNNSFYQSDVDHICEVIQYLWLDVAQEKSCAELQTLYKIIEEEQSEEFDIFLLATDTILSVLAAILIKEYLKVQGTIDKKKVRCIFNNDINAADTSIIKGLQIKNADEFEKYGVDNLLKSVRKFSANGDDVIFNISGGYKIIIPYLTLYAQIYNISLRYLYNNSTDKNTSTTLLEVPGLPFSFEQKAVYRYYLLMQDGKDYFSNNHQKENEAAKSLIEECNQLGLLRRNKITSLGRLFKSYVSDYMAESKGSLGFFMEHKLLQFFQYYDDSVKNGRVLQSVEIVPITDRKNIPKGNEIDIFIETEGFQLYNELIAKGKRSETKPIKESYITIEVKPLGSINLKQFECFLNRVQQFWADVLPKEVRIIVYSFLPKEYALYKFNSDNKIISCANKVKEILGSIPFKAQLVNFDIAFSKNGIKNELMKEHLKKEHFIGKQVFINGIKQNS